MKPPVWAGLSLIIGASLVAGCGGGGGDNRGILSFTGPGFDVGEDGTVFAQITIQRLGGDGAVGATVLVMPETASAPGDFDPSPITVTWDAGDLSDKVISVIVLDDVFDEPDETILLKLVNPTGGAEIRDPLGDAILTIVDDDVGGNIRFSSPSYLYGEDGMPVFFTQVTVQRTQGKNGIVTARLTSMDDGANSDPASAAEPVDYTPVDQTITFFDQDDAPQVITLAGIIRQEVLPERNETFQLVLSDPTGGATVGNPATVEIQDDDFVLEIPNPSPTAGGMFGASVAKLGPNIVVGAPGNSASAGAAYVFDPSTGMLVDTISRPFSTKFGTALLVSGNTLPIAGSGNVWVLDADDLGDRFVLSSTLQGFGEAMTVLADGRLVVGAPRAQVGGAPLAGAVRVFDELTGVPLQSLDGLAGEELGTSFGLFGADLLVGAPGGMGAVFQFGGTPLALSLLIANPVAEPSPRFGAALAVPDPASFLVGSPGADAGAFADAGRVDLVSPAGFVPASIPVAGARFGSNVVVAGGTICIQAEGDGPMGSGRVHVYDSLLSFSFLTFEDPAPTAGEDFGAAMCEFDGALVVGAPLKDGGFATGVGTLFIYGLPVPFTR